MLHYNKIIIDKINIHSNPAIDGTTVRFMIDNGDSLIVPATIKMTAATGEHARKRLPANPIGKVTASGLMFAAIASGTISGSIAKNKDS